MSGKRQPTEVVEANGKKHLSDREKALREQAEVRPSEPIKSLTVPKWLDGTEERKEFRAIAKQLIDLMPTMLIRHDAEQLAMYCRLHSQWLKASGQLADCLKYDADLDSVKVWTTTQSKLFGQCQALAASMGLTITSRCQLVVPKRTGSGTGTGSGASPPSPLVLLAERRKAASNG